MVGMTGFEPATSSSRTTRATKLRHIPIRSPSKATSQEYPIRPADVKSADGPVVPGRARHGQTSESFQAPCSWAKRPPPPISCCRGAVLHDASVVDHQHPVRGLHGGQPVRDDQRRAGPPQQPVPCSSPARPSWTRRSRRDVQRGRGLVQDQHGRAGQERPGEADQLALPGGDAAAALVDVGVVAVRQRQDELVRADRPGGVLDLLRGEASGRPRAMLSATEPLNRKASWVTMTTFRRRSVVVSWRRSTPSSGQGPGGDVVEAGNQLGEGGLAGAGLPDQGDGLAGGDVQVQRRDDHRAVAVAELDAAEVDAALARRAGPPGSRAAGRWAPPRAARRPSPAPPGRSGRSCRTWPSGPRAGRSAWWTGSGPAARRRPGRRRAPGSRRRAARRRRRRCRSAPGRAGRCR